MPKDLNQLKDALVAKRVQERLSRVRTKMQQTMVEQEAQLKKDLKKAEEEYEYAKRRKDAFVGVVDSEKYNDFINQAKQGREAYIETNTKLRNLERRKKDLIDNEEEGNNKREELRNLENEKQELLVAGKKARKKYNENISNIKNFFDLNKITYTEDDFGQSENSQLYSPVVAQHIADKRALLSKQEKKEEEKVENLTAQLTSLTNKSTDFDTQFPAVQPLTPSQIKDAAEAADTFPASLIIDQDPRTGKKVAFNRFEENARRMGACLLIAKDAIEKNDATKAKEHVEKFDKLANKANLYIQSLVGQQKEIQRNAKTYLINTKEELKQKIKAKLGANIALKGVANNFPLNDLEGKGEKIVSLVANDKLRAQYLSRKSGVEKDAAIEVFKILTDHIASFNTELRNINKSLAAATEIIKKERRNPYVTEESLNFNFKEFDALGNEIFSETDGQKYIQNSGNKENVDDALVNHLQINLAKEQYLTLGNQKDDASKSIGDFVTGLDKNKNYVKENLQAFGDEASRETEMNKYLGIPDPSNPAPANQDAVVELVKSGGLKINEIPAGDKFILHKTKFDVTNVKQAAPDPVTGETKEALISDQNSAALVEEADKKYSLKMAGKINIAPDPARKDLVATYNLVDDDKRFSDGLCKLPPHKVGTNWLSGGAWNRREIPHDKLVAAMGQMIEGMLSAVNQNKARGATVVLPTWLPRSAREAGVLYCLATGIDVQKDGFKFTNEQVNYAIDRMNKDKYGVFKKSTQNTSYTLTPKVDVANIKLTK